MRRAASSDPPLLSGLQATPLAVRYGAGYPFQVKQQETWVEIKKLIEKIPVRPLKNHHTHPKCLCVSLHIVVSV